MMPLLMPTKMDEKIIREVIEKNGGRGFAVKNIPIEEYHTGPGISSSDIKDLVNGTVEAWLYKKKNPKAPTPALILGNAIHTAVLEPDQFSARYCLDIDAPVAPSRSTTEGKAEFKAYKEWFIQKEGIDQMDFTMDADEWRARWMKWRHPSFNKIVLSAEDIKTCWAIAESVKNHPMVSQMFAEGESEVTLYWLDQETDVLCKCRPDRLNQSFPCIPDLKSTASAALDDFENDITTHDYHVSAWWYLWGAKEVFGIDFENFVYIPAEKAEPFQVTFYTADEGSLSVGEGLCRAGLAIYKKYLQESAKGETWKGYSLEPKAAGIRPWAFNKLSQVIHSHDLHGMGLEKFVGQG